MKNSHFKDALNLFVEITKAQPNMIATVAHSEFGGKKLAETVWGFIDEFEKKRAEKITD